MKLITNMICSKSQTKSLLDLAEDWDRQEREKLAASQPKKVKTAKVKKTVVKKKSAKISNKTVKTASPKAKKTVAKKYNKKASKKTVAKTKKTAFTRIAKLTDKDRGYLNKYFRKYYPSDYVDALLSTY